MKKYTVIFDPGAAEEALAAAEYIAQDAPLNAAKWYEGFEAAIQKLAKIPNRCPVAPESEFLGVELRHLIYFSHRIIFRIDEKKTILIMHIRHSAQKAIGEPGREDDNVD